jgi:hypothetical protein
MLRIRVWVVDDLKKSPGQRMLHLPTYKSSLRNHLQESYRQVVMRLHREQFTLHKQGQLWEF